MPASGVITKNEIADRMTRSLDQCGSLVITPPPLPRDYDKDSVDLRLGCYFFMPRGHRAPCFCPGRTPAEHLYEEEYIPLGSYLVLPAHSTVLGATLEYIKLPFDMAGQILTKSSWARTFITIETAPWVPPLYRGCLTLEIANASNTPIVLYPGVKIAQLVFLRTSTTRKAGNWDLIEGTYIGPVRPEPGDIRGPGESLKDLNVNRDEIMLPFEQPAGWLADVAATIIIEYREKLLETKAGKTVGMVFDKNASEGRRQFVQWVKEEFELERPWQNQDGVAMLADVYKWIVSNRLHLPPSKLLNNEIARTQAALKK